MVERGGKDSLVTALFLSRAVQVHDSAMRVTDDELYLEILTSQSRQTFLKNVLKIESVGDYYLWE